MESNCTLWSQRNNQETFFRGEHIYHKIKDFKNKILFAKPKILTSRCHAHRGVEFLNFVIQYLGKIKTDFENTLACLSGAQIGSNQEKKEVKNLVTQSL